MTVSANKKPTKDEILQNIHDGRRAKLRNRFLREGIKSFSESEVLEFALGFCIPRLDTNPIAHRLLDAFGNLQNVLNASPVMLERVANIGENTAVFLSWLKHLTTYIASMRLKQTKIKTLQDSLDYLRPLMKTYDVEEFVLLCLSKDGTVLLMETFTSHSINKVDLNLRWLVELLIRVKTAAAIIAHNHLDNNPLPSNADMFLTRQLTQGCMALGIEPVDHLIFAGDKYFSFAESGITNSFKNEYLQIISTPLPLEKYITKHGINTLPSD
jgi:DNA repair protein RadC